MSGYTSNYCKQCDDRCSNRASPYFRTASTSASFKGVAFDTDCHHPNIPSNRLISEKKYLQYSIKVVSLVGLNRSTSTFSTSYQMARFILDRDHPSWTNLANNWASNDSSSDNSSVYKYGQTDGSSVQTGYLDNSSSSTNYPNSSSGRMIRLFARIYTQTNYQTNYRCLLN